QDELLRIWRQTRKTVLMITHDVDEAVYLSDRICVMSARPGRIVEAFEVRLDRAQPREAIVLSDQFRDIRNKVWLSVRQQAGRREPDEAAPHAARDARRAAATRHPILSAGHLRRALAGGQPGRRF